MMSNPSIRREVVLGDVLELVEALRDQALRWTASVRPGIDRARVQGGIAMLRLVSSAVATLASMPTIDEDQDRRAERLRAIVRVAVHRTGTGGIDGKEAEA